MNVCWVMQKVRVFSRGGSGDWQPPSAHAIVFDSNQKFESFA